MDFQSNHDTNSESDSAAPVEIAIVGDLTDNEGDLTEKLLGIEPGGSCTIYFDSPGGSPYCAMSLMTLIRMRRLDATGIVTGECSSAALWPFAACKRRVVTPFSVLLFHPMRWQSDENVGLAEAAEWARHFGSLERDMDKLLADLFEVPYDEIASWITPGKYVSGSELAQMGIAELLDLNSIDSLLFPAVPAAPAANGSAGGLLKAHRPVAARKGP